MPENTLQASIFTSANQLGETEGYIVIFGSLFSILPFL